MHIMQPERIRLITSDRHRRAALIIETQIRQSYPFSIDQIAVAADLEMTVKRLARISKCRKGFVRHVLPLRKILALIMVIFHTTSQSPGLPLLLGWQRDIQPGFI